MQRAKGGGEVAETSEKYAQAGSQARKIQQARGYSYALMPTRMIRKRWRMSLSARALDRVPKGSPHRGRSRRLGIHCGETHRRSDPIPEPRPELLELTGALRELPSKLRNVFMRRRPIRVAGIAMKYQAAGFQLGFKFLPAERNRLVVVVRTYNFEIHAVFHDHPVWRRRPAVKLS
jgi:hypothetical protein